MSKIALTIQPIKMASRHVDIQKYNSELKKYETLDISYERLSLFLLESDKEKATRLTGWDRVCDWLDGFKFTGGYFQRTDLKNVLGLIFDHLKLADKDKSIHKTLIQLFKISKLSKDSDSKLNFLQSIKFLPKSKLFPQRLGYTDYSLKIGKYTFAKKTPFLKANEKEKELALEEIAGDFKLKPQIIDILKNENANTKFIEDELNKFFNPVILSEISAPDIILEEAPEADEVLASTVETHVDLESSVLSHAAIDLDVLRDSVLPMSPVLETIIAVTTVYAEENAASNVVSNLCNATVVPLYNMTIAPSFAYLSSTLSYYGSFLFSSSNISSTHESDGDDSQQSEPSALIISSTRDSSHENYEIIESHHGFRIDAQGMIWNQNQIAAEEEDELAEETDALLASSHQQVSHSAIQTSDSSVSSLQDEINLVTSFRTNEKLLNNQILVKFPILNCEADYEQHKLSLIQSAQNFLSKNVPDYLSKIHPKNFQPFVPSKGKTFIYNFKSSAWGRSYSIVLELDINIDDNKKCLELKIHNILKLEMGKLYTSTLSVPAARNLIEAEIRKALKEITDDFLEHVKETSSSKFISAPIHYWE